jgi:hypothetical protein
VREQRLLSAILAPFDVFPVAHRVVDAYGGLRVALESFGAGMGALDTFIAAQALSLGATLVTSNTREFATVPGLQIEDWRGVAKLLHTDDLTQDFLCETSAHQAKYDSAGDQRGSFHQLIHSYFRAALAGSG